MSTPTVHLMSNWVPVAEVFPSALRFGEALNSGSTGWTCTVPFRDDHYAKLLDADGAGSGVRVVDGQRVFVGVLVDLDVDGTSMVLAGVPLVSTLADRVPTPEPANVAGPWVTDAGVTVSGEPVAAWAAFLGAHVATANDRRLPQSCTVIGEGTSPGTVEFVARWSPDLLGLVEEHATASGVAIDAALVRDSTNTDTELVFTVRALRDNVGVVFDPDLGTVAGWRAKHRVRRVTHVYAGGDGDGTARVARVRSQAGPRRVERWVESSGDADAVDAAADAALAAGAASTVLEVELVDGPGPRFGVDYLLGDLVTIRIAGVGQVSERVLAVETTLADGALVRSVTVGGESLRLPSSGDVIRRLGRLEGR